MKRQAIPPTFDFWRVLLQNARSHFKLILGLSATHPEVKYIDAFSFGQHIVYHDELALTPEQEEHAFAALEHCGAYLAVVQIHATLESIHPDPFQIAEPEIAAAFQIARLMRNAFAHNPFRPVWDISGSWRNRVLAVSGVISLNTTDLNARPVKREHYGGPIAILRFIQYAESIVELRARERAT